MYRLQTMYTYVHTYTHPSMYTGMGLATDVWVKDAAQMCRPRYIIIGLGTDRQATVTTGIQKSTKFGKDVWAEIEMQMYMPQYRCTDAQKSRDLQALVQIYIQKYRKINIYGLVYRLLPQIFSSKYTYVSVCICTCPHAKHKNTSLSTDV